jgi:hypothetical protein
LTGSLPPGAPLSQSFIERTSPEHTLGISRPASA